MYTSDHPQRMRAASQQTFKCILDFGRRGERAVTGDDWTEDDERDLDDWLVNEDPGEECGRWVNGRLGPWRDCRLAGTEFCQFECPYYRVRP